MKIRSCLAFACICLLAPAGVCAAPAANAKASPEDGEQSAGILQLLGGGTKKENSIWRLNRHWAGTLKTVSMSALYKEDKREGKDEPVRFNSFNESFRMGLNRQGFPALLAEGKHGVAQIAYYRKELPSSADLKDREKLSGICAAFGRQHGYTDGWGSRDHRHWTEGWKWFGPAEKGQIRVLTVFTHVSRKEGEPKQYDEWIIREGLFNAYDPADKEGLREFPSEEENEAKRQAEIDAEDNKLPEPLRSYVKARHAEGDHELKAWFAAVRKFRAAPDGQLLKQIAARLDDGTTEMSGALETLFHHEVFDKDIGKWDPQKRQQARVMLVEAFPEADSDQSLQEMVELALRETGVGHLKLSTAELELNVSSRYTKNGETTSYETFTLKTRTVRRAGELLRDEIFKRWRRKQ